MTDNYLYYGNNLDILKRYIKDESVDLVYLDPPFNSNANYNVLFAEKDGSRAAAQIQASSENVVELARSRSPIVQSLAKVESIADATAVVHREDDISKARQILVHRIGVGIVVHVMPAEKHLPPRTAVKENERSVPPVAVACWQKELPVDLHSVSSRKNHLLRNNELRSGKIRRNELRSQIAELSPLYNGWTDRKS